MTLLRLDELAQLTTLDQALLWCIVSINDANLDPRNFFISDNAAIRAESANYIQWNVTQDDKGQGKFVFTVLLPLVNPNPLQDKESLLERVWSYSPFEPQQEFDAGIAGYGYGIPVLPAWVDTSERLLAYLGVLAALISRYARLTKGDENFWALIKPEYWADIKYLISDSAYGGTMTITGEMSLDWSSYLQGLSLIKCLNPYSRHASDINCNFPRLDILWAVPDVALAVPDVVLALPPGDFTPLIPAAGDFSVGDAGRIMQTESSANALINSYVKTKFNDDALPDWYLDAINNPQSASLTLSGGTTVLGNATPQLIESLTICKEQDPDMISYANDLGEKPPRK